MTNPIVSVNVSLQIAAAPATLQQTGAAISQGATTQTKYASLLLTQPSDLTAHLTGALAITSITQSAGTATATTTAPHGFTVSDTILLTIAGATGATTAYNGTFLCTITGASAFTYAVPSGTTSPATGTIVYTPEDVAELLQMVTTFFAQGTNVPLYVLELGPGNATDGATALGTYLTANPNTNYVPGASGYYYSYLVPREWDANATFLTLLASYEAPTSKTYFFVTTTLQTYASYTSVMKCIVAEIESPALGVWPGNVMTASSYSGGQVTFTTTSAHGVAVGQWFQTTGATPTGYNGWFLAAPGTTGSTLVANVPAALGAISAEGSLVANYYANPGIGASEFSLAAAFRTTLGYAPTSTNKVPPLNVSFEFGVTPFPTQGNQALLTTLGAASINYVGTGAAGGIAENLLVGGITKDGNPFNYWYAVDWTQINIPIAITNAVINGSNNPANPLYLNQAGIDALQGVGAATLGRGVSYGLLLGSVVQAELDGPAFSQALAVGTYAGNVVINAVPFVDYYSPTENPGDYAIGKYAGFTIVLTPQRGFSQIVFDIIVTNFVAQ